MNKKTDRRCYMKISSTKLKHYRKKTGLTSQEFAKRCNIPIGTYFSYEAGGRNPKSENLNAIAKTLGVNVEELEADDKEYKLKEAEKDKRNKERIAKERLQIDNYLLRTKRKQLRIRTEYMAEIVGLSISRYREYEQGKGMPTREMIRKMCNVLNLSFYDLVQE